MGSGGSKNAAAANDSAASSFDGGGRTLRYKRASRAFKSSCFCPSFALEDLPEIKHEKRNACTDEGENERSQENDERCRKLTNSPSYIVPTSPSATDHNNDDSTVQINRASSTAVGAIRRTFSNASRTASSPCEMPNGMDNSLTRTLSLQASRACNSAHAGDSTLDDDSVEDVIRNNSRDEQPVGHREHSEGNMQLRQMTGIGRLHDRSVHRVSFSEGLIDTVYVEANLNDHASQASLRRGFSSLRRTSPSHRRGEVFHDGPRNRSHHMTDLLDAVHNHHPENPQPRETNSNLGEQTSSFHERRRRVISQVRALQRLGSRFENSSGHERSCILSGQYRTGRCMCRGSYRSSNHTDDSSTNASISRIVMLAEALFEVLDEIHQQSVLLTSQTSFSSIGSVPAPKEVVENMPLRNFTKQQGHGNEGTSQCYICLLDYEEGEYMRILPCNHKFHQVCIDKWLKEIHRVCPLCRADVCNYEAKTMGKPS
ncbi:hypothetical protein HPP92_015132 [Vanilla planifolia]|uniref:RING-type domain-containing protein n=1 Tax=Vanilla planifolia TaxID=51239 RepID=A0A835UUT5_VANPL|nr:hypothetical protein HPP92_015132 [Vanilla planifolia]